MSRKKPAAEKAPVNGWSVTALADALRLNPRTVQRRLANVRPIGHKGRSALYDLADAAPAIFGQATASEQEHHKAEILRCRAERERIALEDMRGDLCRRRDVEELAFTEAREYRDALLNWPDRVAGKLGSEFQINTKMLAIALEREVRQHLTEIATEYAVKRRTAERLEQRRRERRNVQTGLDG